MNDVFNFGVDLFMSSIVFVAWTIANYQDKKKTLLTDSEEKK